MTGSDAVAEPSGVLGFRRLTPADFGLLGTWLAAPHVARWWNHDPSPAAVERDFGPTARGEEPAEDLLVLLDDRPVGLLQRCYWHDFPEYVAEVRHLLEIPRGAVTVDYLIGAPERTGHGIGTRMIRTAVADVWRRYPDAPAVVVPVVAANRRSWRALERAGFHRVVSGELDPDNPVDDRLHHVYRVDRPVGGTGAAAATAT